MVIGECSTYWTKQNLIFLGLILELWHDFILKIGPIPTDDGLGKEVVTRMTANMQTNKVFYTDSNGTDFIERVTPLTSFFIQYTQVFHRKL